MDRLQLTLWLRGPCAGAAVEDGSGGGPSEGILNKQRNYKLSIIITREFLKLDSPGEIILINSSQY